MDVIRRCTTCKCTLVILFSSRRFTLAISSVGFSKSLKRRDENKITEITFSTLPGLQYRIDVDKGLAQINTEVRGTATTTTGRRSGLSTVDCR